MVVCDVQEPTLSAAAVMKFDTIRIMILWLDVCVSAYVCERDAMHLASVCQVISVYKLEKNKILQIKFLCLHLKCFEEIV